jgi:hypothetical protein
VILGLAFVMSNHYGNVVEIFYGCHSSLMYRFSHGLMVNGVCIFGANPL